MPVREVSQTREFNYVVAPPSAARERRIRGELTPGRILMGAS